MNVHIIHLLVVIVCVAGAVALAYNDNVLLAFFLLLIVASTRSNVS